jgi:hypothetical protein
VDLLRNGHRLPLSNRGNPLQVTRQMYCSSVKRFTGDKWVRTVNLLVELSALAVFRAILETGSEDLVGILSRVL